MGRSESATSSIGYRVSLRDLLESIHDEESLTYTYDTLIDENTFVEDDNNEDNNTFLTITYQLKKKDSWTATKEEWIHQFKKMLQYDLLIPVMILVGNTRWGYNREGIHGNARPVPPDFSEELNRLYENCPPYHTVSWIIQQAS